MEIVISRRYRGPLTSANGGYTCGRLAAFVAADTVEVTLRRPPPLERPLRVERGDSSALLFDTDALVADAHAAVLELEAPERVTLDEAEEARTRHVRVGDDVFAECFTCGVRDNADGLAVYAGPVARKEPIHAAPVTFPESSPEVVWAAIDCPGAYSVGAAGRGAMVLGRMTARVERVPDEGETCIVVAWPLGEDGRKLYAGTALVSPEGDLLALARQVWIEPR